MFLQFSNLLTTIPPLSHSETDLISHGRKLAAFVAYVKRTGVPEALALELVRTYHDEFCRFASQRRVFEGPHAPANCRCVIDLV